MPAKAAAQFNLPRNPKITVLGSNAENKSPILNF